MFNMQRIKEYGIDSRIYSPHNICFHIIPDHDRLLFGYTGVFQCVVKDPPVRFVGSGIFGCIDFAKKKEPVRSLSILIVVPR